MLQKLHKTMFLRSKNVTTPVSMFIWKSRKPVVCIEQSGVWIEKGRRLQYKIQKTRLSIWAKNSRENPASFSWKYEKWNEMKWLDQTYLSQQKQHISWEKSSLVENMHTKQFWHWSFEEKMIQNRPILLTFFKRWNHWNFEGIQKYVT